MPIRIESKKGQWIEWRDKAWTFGDRLAIIGASDDSAALGLILKYVVGWNLMDQDGKPLPYDKGATGLLAADDEDVTWIIRSWFQARSERNAVPKET